jgi:hypothetical protein
MMRTAAGNSIVNMAFYTGRFAYTFDRTYTIINSTLNERKTYGNVGIVDIYSAHIKLHHQVNSAQLRDETS